MRNEAPLSQLEARTQLEDDEGIVTLHPFDGPLGAELERVSLALRAVPVPHDEGADAAASALLDAAITQLDEYFDGDRRSFDLDLDWRLVRGFTRDALQAVREIPYGETAGYGEVAIAAGSPRAARAVGTACATTPFSIVVPVHRVVRADGSLGYFQHSFSVYDREGEGCRTPGCGGTVGRIVQGGRSTFRCAGCQR